MKQLIILAVEDDPVNREVVKAAFQEGGHTVHTAQSIEDCWKSLKTIKPDVMILDRGLPDGDGIQLCLTLKKDALLREIPILMLTGRAEVQDRILGLRFGADDYLPKPFDIEELRARVHALARRALGELSPILAAGGITMDLKSRGVTVSGRHVHLTNREFALLRFFMENPNSILTRESLLAAVWRGADQAGPKVVDVTVMNLRRKLGGTDCPIISARSLGYKFDPAR